jgi:hypothetical protein
MKELPKGLRATDREGHVKTKVDAHLVVLQRMSKETSPRYQPRLNILGCFALLHSVRSGRPQRPSPIRLGINIRVN